MARDLSRTYFREIKEVYDFVAEQVTAGLFKSDIMDRLIELGIDRQLAFDVLDEMERRLSDMRKRVVVLAMSKGEQQELLRREFWICGYHVVIQGDLAEFKQQLVEKVPDLVLTDAFDFEMKGRDVLRMLRSHIVGRSIPVFVLTEKGMGKEDFEEWDRVWVFQKPFDADHVVKSAKEFFFKKFFGEE